MRVHHTPLAIPYAVPSTTLRFFRATPGSVRISSIGARHFAAKLFKDGFASRPSPIRLVPEESCRRMSCCNSLGVAYANASHLDISYKAFQLLD